MPRPYPREFREGAVALARHRRGRLHWPHRGRLKWLHLASVLVCWLMLPDGWCSG